MNVLKCEFIKLAKNTPFKITLAIVWIVSAVFGFFMTQNISLYADYYECFDGFNGMLNSFADSALYVIIGAVMAALFICADFENRTIQESITCGNSHMNIVAGKAFVYTLSLVVICLPYPLLFGGMMAVRTGWGVSNCGVAGAALVGKLALFLVTVFFSYLPMILFFVFVSFLVRKVGVSFAVNIPVMLVGNRVLAMYMQSFDGKSNLITKLYDYSLFGLCDKIFSYMNLYGKNVMLGVTWQHCLPIIAAGIVWSVVLLIGTVYCFKKRDLK